MIFWRREYCKPVVRITRYWEKEHHAIFDGWWACQNCHARDPGLNKRKCTNLHDNDDRAGDDEHIHNIRNI
eukprot:16446443-Heterocapsa_arctica.AAC.1